MPVVLGTDEVALYQVAGWAEGPHPRAVRIGGRVFATVLVEEDSAVRVPGDPVVADHGVPSSVDRDALAARALVPELGAVDDDPHAFRDDVLEPVAVDQAVLQDVVLRPRLEVDPDRAGV